MTTLVSEDQKGGVYVGSLKLAPEYTVILRQPSGAVIEIKLLKEK